MKTRRFIALVLIVGLILALVPASTRARPAAPQETEPPPPPRNLAFDLPGQTCERTSEDQRAASKEPSRYGDTGELTPQDTGGPDNFGYTWDDSVPLNWIDAQGGTETGISRNTDHVGPVDIGFSFKYYENAYSQLYISRFGFVAFNNSGIYHSQSQISFETYVPYPMLRQILLFKKLGVVLSGNLDIFYYN